MSKRRQSTAARESFQVMTTCCEAPGSQGARSRWESVWRETVADDHLGAVDIEATGYTLYAGWHLVMVDGRFCEAADLLLSYFEHPGIDQADRVVPLEFRRLIAYSLLEAGAQREAIAHLRLLVDTTTDAGVAMMAARNTLYTFCLSRNGTDVASEALTELVQEVAHRMKLRKVHRWQPGALSYADLTHLLQLTFPAETRARLQRSRDEELADGRSDGRPGST